MIVAKSYGAAPQYQLIDFTLASLPASVTPSGGTNGTRFNSSGVMVAATAPRFDYDPALVALTGGLPALLVEEARTNYLWPSLPATGSGGWTVTAGDTITVNAGVGPNGTSTASQVALRDGRTNATGVFYANASLPNPHVAAAWVKGTKGESVFFFCDALTRASWKLHTFNGSWERTTAISAALTSSSTYFSTTRAGGGVADATNGLPAVTFLVSHCDVQNGTFITSTIWTTVASVARTSDEPLLTSGAPLAIMKQATGSVVAELVRKPTQIGQGIIIGGDITNSWEISDCHDGAHVKLGIYGVHSFCDAGAGLRQGYVQRAGGSWQVGAHASCIDGYTVTTSTDASTLAAGTSYGLGVSPGSAGFSINGWLLKYYFYATKLSTAALQVACGLTAPAGIGAALPRGADLLNYTNKVIDLHPHVADIAPGYSGSYPLFDSQWYASGAFPPDPSKYSDTGNGLAIPYNAEVVTEDRNSQAGTLPFLSGADGWYCEWDVKLSSNHPNNFPAVWMLPQEHNAAKSDVYGGGPGYEQFMELDCDEGGFGLSTTSSVIDWEGVFDNGAYWRDYPTDTVPGNIITNSVAKGYLDRTQLHTFGVSYQPSTNTARWYLDNNFIFQATTPAIAKQQHFYMITGAQSFAATFYTMYLSRIRAYTLPAVLPDTFNPSDKSASITLSNGNLTATIGTPVSDDQVRSVTSRQYGLIGVRFTFTTHASPATRNMAFGLASASHAFATYLGGDNKGVGFYPGLVAKFFFNGTETALGDLQATTGDVFEACIALAGVGERFWVRRISPTVSGWNNDILANQNPALFVGGANIAGINGYPLFLCGDFEVLNDALTMDTSTASSLATSGYNRWREAGKWLVGYGDSIMFGTGVTSYYRDTFLFKLAGYLGRYETEVNRGNGGESSNAIADRFVSADPAIGVTGAGGYGVTDTIYILEGGYNNYTQVAGTVEGDFARMVAALPVGAKYIIMGIPTADVAAIYTGGADRAKLDLINTNLSNTYGSRFFDTDAALKAQSTHAGQDAIDDGHGVTPASQRAAGDAVHPGTPGYNTIYLGLKAKVQALGYG